MNKTVDCMHLNTKQVVTSKAKCFIISKCTLDGSHMAESSSSLTPTLLLTASDVLPCIPDCMRRLADGLCFRISPIDLYGLQRCETVVEVRHQPICASRLVREDQHLGNEAENSHQ